ncbi:3-oxoacyl-[acyl-carrier-protein] synthase I, partial [Populus alba x Populus x berolinensis]
MVSQTVSAPEREKDPKKRAVITGMGLVSVFGSGIDTFYDKLLEGESGISLIDRFDASSFSVRFAGQIRDFSCKGYIDGKNDRRLDDCWRYCLVAGKRALEDANLGSEVKSLNMHAFQMDRTRVGVLVGTGMGGLTVFSNGVESLVQKGYKKMSPFFIPYSITNTGSALLAIDTGSMGPNYSISTACATANYCFYSAADHIRRGEADIMVAGGTEASVIPTGVGGFIACRALSQRNEDPKKASRPWDRDHDDFVMGEGSGVLVNYVNAHATSTLAGDLAEVNAIKKVFKNTSEIKMNGTKSMIGHGLGAAGALEAIATIKAINTGWLHPTINQDNIELDVTIDTVPNVKKQHEVNV